MLPAGLDLGRRRIEVCLLSSKGEIVDEWASPPDADGLRGLAARAAMWTPAVRGVIESLNGARLVHDRLEEHGWDVLIADATKGQGPGAAGLQDRQGSAEPPTCVRSTAAGRQFSAAWRFSACSGCAMLGQTHD